MSIQMSHDNPECQMKRTKLATVTYWLGDNKPPVITSFLLISAFVKSGVAHSGGCNGGLSDEADSWVRDWCCAGPGACMGCRELSVTKFRESQLFLCCLHSRR